MEAVINPETYWIDGRCYRRNPCNRELPSHNQRQWSTSGDLHVPENKRGASQTHSTLEESRHRGPYIEKDEYECDPEEDPCDDVESYDIKKSGNGFETECDIPSPLFGSIIGFKGQTKMRIERETRTKIFVPKQGERKPVVVRGSSLKDVRNGRRRTEVIASQARLKRDATHFICFPLSADHVVRKVKEFKEEVLRECGKCHIRGITEDLFVEAEKFHLTICVLVLLDESERIKASDILKNARQEIQKSIELAGKLPIQIKGLEIMNDDPTQVDVLFANCVMNDNGKTLQEMANFFANAFAKSGLTKEKWNRDGVKLHATLLNSRKSANNPGLSDANGGASAQNYGRQNFDASLILSKFRDFDFGLVEITDVKLATRFTTADDGFYKSYSSVPL